MRTSIIIFPGSNCDQDVASSLYCIFRKKPNLVWYKNKIPKNVDLIIIPGGFSFGDYLRSGAIASASNIIKQVIAFARKGVPIIGICNGFQILTEARLLPGTLMINKNLKFICKNVYLKIVNKTSVYSKGFNKNIFNLPIAHKMGNYTISDEGLSKLIDNDQIALKYCSKNGETKLIDNPNGSVLNIAGVLSKNHRILGMMPHPERFSDISNKDEIMDQLLRFIK
ncbi:MAG: phosphoribosylformylglycinamidine synthase I [Rickettsiales bacterium]|nr:phosphoribosylformylglycinamidine synthase I [Rickettsiales bacterium]OUV83099.1 MAG: phosphoribosylformylglycinamidine synthase I [Rickettsiales bacterium TMED131]|tara:strand:+ start:361 stop:1035 length:675 start_codon:yes stop_codon:yes gene_type:complete